MRQMNGAFSFFMLNMKFFNLFLYIYEIIVAFYKGYAYTKSNNRSKKSVSNVFYASKYDM